MPLVSSLSLDWLIEGQEYRRTALHEKLGGQRQGGISTPVSSPVVLLFTGGTGQLYGYQDRWIEDGIFLYAGEGQRGDMEWKGGNNAIRDHAESSKDLLLFESVKKAWVEFVGRFVCNGFRLELAPDIDGSQRTAIVFELSRTEDFDGDQDATISQLDGLDLNDLRNRALSSSAEFRTPTERKTQVRLRSDAIKRYARRRANGNCEFCLESAPFTTTKGEPYLEVHHVKKLSDGGPDHPEWVVAICPNCHRRAHYSADSITFRASLIEVARRAEATEH